MQQRLRELEEELKKKSDQQQTVSLVQLEQLKERLRQLQEASRVDQQRIFDTYRKHGPAFRRIASCSTLDTARMSGSPRTFATCSR